MKIFVNTYKNGYWDQATGKLIAEERWAIVEFGYCNFYQSPSVPVNIKIFCRKKLVVRRSFRLGTAVKSVKFQGVADVEKFLSEDHTVCGVNLKWAVLSVVVENFSRICSSFHAVVL